MGAVMPSVADTGPWLHRRRSPCEPLTRAWFVLAVCWFILTPAACTSSDQRESNSDSSTDTAPVNTDIPSWGETPFVGDPRTCYWTQLLWTPDADFVAQIRMPFTRNEGVAAVDFSASGLFPLDAELVIVEGSSVPDETFLDSEGCEFETTLPEGYEVPGTWWFARTGAVSVEATYIGEGGDNCGPDQEFVLSVAVSGVEMESLGGTRASVPDSAWNELSVTYPSCPPE